MRLRAPSALLTLVALAGCAAPAGSHGLEAQGAAIGLATGESKYVTAVLQRTARALAQLDLAPLVEEALPRAREQAAAMLGGRYPWVDQNLRALKVTDVDARRVDEVDFAAEDLLDGTVSHTASNQYLLTPTKLPEGKRFFAEVALRVAPWPTGEPFEPHPELLLAQASVLWYADLDGGSFVAQALAEAVVAEVADTIDRITQRRTHVPGDRR